MMWLDFYVILILNGLTAYCNNAQEKTTEMVDSQCNHYKWHKYHLMWRLDKIPVDIEKTKLIGELNEGFELWANVTNFNFEYIDDHNNETQVDIVVAFVCNECTDENNFIAIGYSPDGTELGGDVHFTERIKWKLHAELVTKSREENVGSILQTFTHELGHSLGLDHSQYENSAMYRYQPLQYEKTVQLSASDIDAIQKLYESERQVIN